VKRITFIFLILFIFNFFAQAQEYIPLWPTGKKPNSNGKPITDSIFNERIWRVSNPGIYCFPVPSSENKGTTILICPGGSYERLSYIYNGFQFARWFNSHGINAFVLLYRLPNQADLIQRELAPVQDAQRALKLLRSNANKWGLDPQQIGVMGVSAGGHVASTLATHFKDYSSIGDSLDHASFKADFMILLSPVITMGKFAHSLSKKNFLGPDTSQAMIDEYSNEKQVSSSTPPTFIVQAQDDSTVSVQNSVLYFHALIDKKVNASLHVFPHWGHNIKLVDNPGSTDLWLDLLFRWLQENKFALPINKK